MAAVLAAAFAFLPAVSAEAASGGPRPTYGPEMSDKEFAKKCKKKGGHVVKDGNQRYCVIHIERRSSYGSSARAAETRSTTTR